MRNIELKNRRRFLSEDNGHVIVTLPTGICYNEILKCWIANYVNEDGIWRNKRFLVSKYGLIDGFMEACAFRDRNLGTLTIKRLIARYRSGYKERKNGERYVVSDPMNNYQRHEFDTLEDAKVFHQDIIAKWLKEYGIKLDDLIVERRSIAA